VLGAGGRPIDVVHRVSFGFEALQALSETWAILLNASVYTGFEEGADPLDGLAGSALLGVGHRFSDRFEGGVGVAIATVLEEDPVIVPGIQLRWEPYDGTVVAIEGATLSLRHDLGDGHEVAVGGSLDWVRFRLDDDGPLPSYIVGDLRIPAFLRWTWKPEPDVGVSVVVGHDIFHRLQVDDARAATGTSYDMHLAPFFRFELDVRL
jgi:hypothetical protein